MRAPRILFPILITSACGTDPAIVAGDLADGAEATHVWVLGHPERAAIAADSFHLEGPDGGTLDLRFAAGDREVARMEIQGVERGDRLRLRGVWFDGGIAHPTILEVDGRSPVIVNGLRMGGEHLSGPVEAAATVLSISRSGDAMILRPDQAEMPDLRVVLTPGTRLRTPDGDPASAEDLAPGDSVRVAGEGESGYVVATELILPRSRADGAAAGEPEPAERLAERSAATSRGAGVVRATPSSGDGDRPGRGGRGKGKGKEKKAKG